MLVFYLFTCFLKTGSSWALSATKLCDPDNMEFTDDLQVCKNLDIPRFHLLFWSELDFFCSRGQRVVLEGLSAIWQKPLMKRAGEPRGVGGAPVETASPGFHKRRLAGYPSQLICAAQERMKSAPALSHFHSSVMSNVDHTKVPPPCEPPLSLVAVTGGDTIAWHDKIVHVKSHFNQAKCTSMWKQKKWSNWVHM